MSRVASMPARHAQPHHDCRWRGGAGLSGRGRTKPASVGPHLTSGRLQRTWALGPMRTALGRGGAGGWNQPTRPQHAAAVKNWDCWWGCGQHPTVCPLVCLPPLLAVGAVYQARHHLRCQSPIICHAVMATLPVTVVYRTTVLTLIGQKFVRPSSGNARHSAIAQDSLDHHCTLPLQALVLVSAECALSAALCGAGTVLRHAAAVQKPSSDRCP